MAQMLDELLGRAALKDRVAELEEERDRLRAQLDAEEERRRDAASARQDAEERVNRLEDRIADLEGQLARTRDEESGPSFRGVESVKGRRLARVLDRLESFEAGPEGVLTAVVGEDVPAAVREAFGERAPLVERAAPCVAVTDDAGLLSVALTAPAGPGPSVSWGDDVAVDRSWFEPTGSFALALVRSDLFALGEYDGDERVAFEGFESDVKADHSKGGFSQSRFERLRDEQIEEHLERCRAAVEGREAERLYVVGEGTLLREFREEAAATAAVDATGDPEEALADAFRRFWTARLYRL
jgi:peptide subunit release factor 1 (eRF1)